LINGNEALEACRLLEFNTVLDVGSGDGSHAAFFRSVGKIVTTTDIKDADVRGVYTEVDCGKHDLVWCSHVLEHQLDVNRFLRKLYNDTDQWLAITVPPYKPEIVGGHVTVWNAGLLLYNLILAGFDCRDAMVKRYGYNISVIVQKKEAKLPMLKYDFGDIEALSEFFPMSVTNGFNGDIEELNWKN
jgi:hypothetical protein